MSADGEDLAEEKARLRRQVAARLKALSAREFAERGRRALERLEGAEEFRRAGSFLLYAPMPDEIDTTPLIDRLLAVGRAAFLPVCAPDRDEMRAVRIADLGKDLAPGRFGILEPRAGLPAAGPAEIDFLLVPGRAFDRAGRRLGRGRGFYDRFLAGAGEGPFRAALALDLQLFPRVPAGEHDREVELIAPESEILRPRGE